MKVIHPVQLKLLRLADTYNIGSMSFRDIGKIISEEHPQIVKHHLDQLEKKGLIHWDRENALITKAKKGVVTNGDLITIPVLGSANCGEAMAYADEYLEGHIKVSLMLLKNKTKVFAIRAVGSSMNKANIEGKGIEDGDYVIIDPVDKNIKSGDYVLSVIDYVASIKKIMIDTNNDQVILFSESTSSFPPIYIHRSEAPKFLVNGKVIQVIKNS